MISHSTTNTLHAYLRTYGALKEIAWQKIMQLMELQQLKTNDSFLRDEGCLAYVAQGILKEYDATDRNRPAIVNFIYDNHCLITRNFNKRNYLKACVPTLVLYWKFEHLQMLYQEFNELKLIYNSLCTEYDASIALRQLILEKNSVQKIILFKKNFSSIAPFLKKKDIANYLHINYTHFLDINKKTL